MTLDQICTRPNAGAALLHLHRWLPTHGAFEVKQTFKVSTLLKWAEFAAADLTAFAVLDELGQIFKMAPNVDGLVDRALLLLAQEDAFHEVRAFLTLQAAARLAHQRMKAPRPEPIVLLENTDYMRACMACLDTLGIPANLTCTAADGSPYLGRQS